MSGDLKIILRNLLVTFFVAAVVEVLAYYNNCPEGAEILKLILER